jgi:hypothetical protein
MIALPQPSCHNRLKSLNSFSVSLLVFNSATLGNEAPILAHDTEHGPAYRMRACALQPEAALARVET